MEVKKAKVGKIGKKDRELYFVAIVNDSGNVVTGATFLSEADADTTAEMFKAFLNHESIPFKPYEEMLKETDRFFKKLADDEDPLQDDDETSTLHEMQMATALREKIAKS